jgi:hypothetical protein
VLDIRHLNKTLLARSDTHLSGDGVVDSAEFALEMLRFPYRQVFGDVENPVPRLTDVFNPTIRIKTTVEGARSLVERFEEGLS